MLPAFSSTRCCGADGGFRIHRDRASTVRPRLFAAQQIERRTQSRTGLGHNALRSNLTKWPIRGKSAILNNARFRLLTGGLHGFQRSDIEAAEATEISDGRCVSP